MTSVKLTILAAFTTAAAALAGCATTQGNLTNSADRLERNAAVLAHDAREPEASDSSRDYYRDARDLAEQAHDFRHTVEDRGRSDREVKSSFEKLSKTYHSTRDEVEHSGDRQAQDDLRPVTDAYLDVEREMGGYPDTHRYARDGRDIDR
jgi:hypothetical protein